MFDAPWQRRAFGVTIALCRAGACEWESFRRLLMARIAEDEARAYWDSWAAALEDVLATTGALAPSEIEARHTAYLARPPDHDHH